MSGGRALLSPARLWWLAACAAVLLGAVQMTRMTLGGRFSTDEFTYAHAAWLIGGGAEPYRDFFFHHFPFSLQLGSLVLGPGSAPRDMLHLRWLMLAVWPLACAAVWSLAGRRDRRAGPLAAIALLSLPPFLEYGKELRPDSLATTLFVVAVALATLPGARASLSSLVAGVCWTGAVWASEKVLLYGSLLPLAALIDLALRRPRRPQEDGASLLASPRHFVAGALLGAVPVAAYLTLSGNWRPWFHWCYEWNLVHESAYPKRSPWRSFGPTRDQSRQLLVLAIAGWAGALARLRRARLWHAEADLLLAAVAFTTLGSYFIQQAPYQWSMLAPAPLLAIFAGRAAAAALAWLEARAVPAAVQGVLGLAVLALVAEPMSYASRQLEQKAFRIEPQLRMLEALGRMTGPDDPIYDNTGRYVARPHVHYTFFTDATVRATRADWLAREMPRAIEAAGAVAYLHEGRSGGLPPALRKYLKRHFVPTPHGIWLWGQSYRRLSPSAPASFRVTRAGDYYVYPLAVAKKGQLRVGGQPAPAGLVSLTPGEHVVQWAGPNASPRFALVWLPRDRTPRPVDWNARRKLR